MKNPKLSIIIPSYNGAHKIPNLIQALARQKVSSLKKADIEYILVLDGSTDHSREAIQEVALQLPDFQVIEQKNQGRAATRNRGAEVARGELLLFFDDDMRPLDSCTELHYQHHQHYPMSILVGNQLEEEAKMKTDIQKYKAYLSRKWINPLPQVPEPMPAGGVFLTAANFSIPRSLFFQLGGFDRRLRDAEDYDLAIRAQKQAVPIYFDHQALAWHDDYISAAYYVRRLRQYKNAHRHLEALKPEIYKGHFENLKIRTKPWKKLIYHFFSGRFWIKLIDQNYYLLFLPRRIRYKIYDLTLSGLSLHFPEREISPRIPS